MRPPGYEPGELPTAPLRDVNSVAYLLSGCKGTTIFLIVQIFVLLFLISVLFYQKTLDIPNKNNTFAH